MTDTEFGWHGLGVRPFDGVNEGRHGSEYATQPANTPMQKRVASIGNQFRVQFLPEVDGDTAKQIRSAVASIDHFSGNCVQTG